MCDASYTPPQVMRTYDNVIQTEIMSFDEETREQHPPAHPGDGQEQLTSDPPANAEIDNEAVEAAKLEREMRNLCAKVREQCSLISSLTWSVEKVESVRSVNESLSEIYHNFYSECQDHDGVVHLKKDDLPFQTLRKKKPTTPGFHRNRRIIPIGKAKTRKKKNKRITPSTVSHTPLVEIIGDLPKSAPPARKKRRKATAQTRLPTKVDMDKENLDALLDSAESIYVPPEVAKGLSCGGDYFTPFADIHSFTESQTISSPCDTSVPSKSCKYTNR